MDENVVWETNGLSFMGRVPYDFKLDKYLKNYHVVVRKLIVFIERTT